MKATTILALAAIAAAIIASVAAFYGPHPSTEYSGTSPAIITLGLTGKASPEEVAALLNGSGLGPLPPMAYKGTAFLGSTAGSVQEYLGSLGVPSATTTNVQVPGVDEGDILKLAPPYALYVSQEVLYLVRLWPPGNMSVVDKVLLSYAVKDELANINKTWWVPIFVKKPQVLVYGDTAVVAFIYSVNHLPGFIVCGISAEVHMVIGGENITVKVPVCRAKASEYGTAIAVFRFGEEGLERVALHLVEGMALIDSRLEGGNVYLFLKPINPVMTGKESIDGVPILKAGPAYIAATSPFGNSIITAVALNPETGEVGVTNVVVPLSEVTRNVMIYMRDSTAYIILTGGPGISDEALAEKMIACSGHAPRTLWERLEGLGGDASPEEVLDAVKEWVRGVQEEVLPIIRWLIHVTRGDLASTNTTVMNSIRPPVEYREDVERAEEELDKMGDFLDCVASIDGGVTASSTRIVRMVFQGMVGFVKQSTEVPGRVLDRFAVHEDGQYLYIVTTETPGKLRLAIRPLGVDIVYATIPLIITDNGSSRYYIEKAEIWDTVHRAINIAWALEWLKAANSLRDIITADPDPRAKPSSSLSILKAGDLSLVSSLTDLAPGETVRAARYVENYLYLVTYERKDPLFTIDISDPADPEVLGWLELPGYSEYLHPWGDRYLIGLGVENSTWLKVDLYDVSDPANITRISSIIAGYGSPAMYNHHAFQPIDNETFAIPVSDSARGMGIAVFRVTPEEGLKYLGVLRIDSPLRSARIGGVIYAFGTESIIAADLSSLEPISSIKLA